MTDDATKTQIGTMSEELVRWFERAVARAVTVHHGTTGGDFGWALRVMRAGRKVRRACWSTGVSMQAIEEGRGYTVLRLIKDGTGEGAYYWRPLHEDLLAEDWGEFHG